MKKIKKFFITNIFLSFILVGSLYGLSWLWSNYVDDMSVKFLELERKNIKNLKIINVGSSHTTSGIKYPDNVKNTSYNMGLQSQRFYYDFEILKKYYNRFDKNCIIIIPISIFSFYNSYDVRDISQNYIQFLNQEVILGINKKEYILGKYFSATQPMIKIFKVLKYTFTSLKNRNFEKKYIVYGKDFSFEEKKKAAVDTVSKHLGVEDTRYRYDKKIGIKQLKEILEFCEEKGFRPVLISTPQTYLYNEQIGEKNYEERIYDNIKEIENKMNKKYLYLDYSHDKRFENNLEYFFDDDHLNEKGAEYFTEILLNDIKSHGYSF